MNKKVGILTQPLHDNYGGLLQAFALKSTLESLNFDVEIINRRKPYHNLKYRVSNFINKLRGKNVKYSLTKAESFIISKNTKYFAENYIKHITSPVYSSSKLSTYKDKYDIIVVGSDQVWKPAYSPDIANYYLDFVTNEKVVGLAYAASFGGDTWNYSPAQTAVCKFNLRKFRAISVREDSGVFLCKENLNIDAVHVLDPTLLLEKDTYIDLIDKENEPIYNDDILVHYVLDNSDAKQNVIDMLSTRLKLDQISITQKKKISQQNVKENIEECIYPTVTSWLNGFRQAKFVITDSFHGTVFAILFNKPFLVFGNPGRGNARFESLLKIFGLENRFILNAKDFSISDFSDLGEIDWVNVNQILDERRKFSMNFIKDNLAI